MRVENLGYRSVRVIIDIEFLRDVEAQGCEQKGVAFMEGTRRPSPPMVRTNERDGGGREQAGNFPIIPFRDVTCALSRFVIDVSRPETWTAARVARWSAFAIICSCTSSASRRPGVVT